MSDLKTAPTPCCCRQRRRSSDAPLLIIRQNRSGFIISPFLSPPQSIRDDHLEHEEKFFSLEMSVGEIVRRFAGSCSHLKIPHFTDCMGMMSHIGYVMTSVIWCSQTLVVRRLSLFSWDWRIKKGDLVAFLAFHGETDSELLTVEML